MFRVLILGASGRFGSNCATEFVNRGHVVKACDLSKDDLEKSVADAHFVINGWNPPYDKWKKDIPQFTNQVIDALKRSKAKVIIPGNVYNFGENSQTPWGPSSPHLAKNPMGILRIEMEQAYKDAGVPTIILRSGDYLDTSASGNWFDTVMAKNIKRGKFIYPGDPNALHSWAFLPDVARAVADLVECSHQFSAFTDLTFRGYSVTGNDMAKCLSEVCGTEIKPAQFPWWQVQLIKPFWPLAPRLLEMRYLWDHPHELDDAALCATLPSFQYTPFRDAIGLAVKPLMN